MLPVPLAYWPFDEGAGSTAADASGHGHTATITGGLWGAGKWAGALINAGGASAATVDEINLRDTHAIAYWFKGWDGSDDGVVVGGNTGYYATYLDGTDWYYSAASAFVTVPHGGGLADGDWHHLVVSRNIDEVTFYKDGARLGSPQTNAAYVAAHDLFLTTLLSYGDGGFPFHAHVDELRLYDVALSGDQVAELFALTHTPPAAPVPALFFA